MAAVFRNRLTIMSIVIMIILEEGEAARIVG